MTCREVIQFLMEYSSGALPAAERARFEEHLAECPDCVGYLKSYEATLKLGKAAFRHPDEPASPDVPEALLRAILAARRGQTG